MNDTPKTDKIPLGKQIDLLYELRAQRLAKQKEVEELKKIETSRVNSIKETMEEIGMESATGSLATFSLNETTVPKLVDYSALIMYIKDSGYIHLLGRKVSAPAYRELIELGEEIPGVEPYTFSRPSITRSKK